MTYTFTVDKKSFATHKKLLLLLETSLKENTASTEKEYNKLIYSIISALQKEKLPSKSPLFTKEIALSGIASPLVEKTVWGCVNIKKADTAKDFVQKLLVVRQHGILGFEIHKQKLEKLKILEGLCILISSQHKSKTWKKGVAALSLGKKGTKVTLQPGDEHGIIALTNCVIEETSTNHLDDLVYIFNSQQAA